MATAFSVIPIRTFVRDNKDNLIAMISDRAPKLENLFERRQSIRRAQQLVPEHQRILTLTDTAMMLDFVRNPIWSTGDNAGEASPPPGLLNLQDPSELRSYLLNLGISYVLFEPDTDWRSSVKTRVESRAKTLLQNPWDYYEVSSSERAYENIARLANQSEVQWSNQFEVIKLTSP